MKRHGVKGTNIFTFPVLPEVVLNIDYPVHMLSGRGKELLPCITLNVSSRGSPSPTLVWTLGWGFIVEERNETKEEREWSKRIFVRELFRVHVFYNNVRDGDPLSLI